MLIRGFILDGRHGAKQGGSTAKFEQQSQTRGSLVHHAFVFNFVSFVSQLAQVFVLATMKQHFTENLEPKVRLYIQTGSG